MKNELKKSFLEPELRISKYSSESVLTSGGTDPYLNDPFDDDFYFNGGND